MTLILNGTDNSATTPAVTGTDTDTGVYYPAANQVALATNGTLALIVDSSQNVGMGVTPSAWFSGVKAVQFGTAGCLFSNNDRANLASNLYIDSGTNSRYINNGFALRYAQEVGEHVWTSAPSGTAGNVATLTRVLAVEKDKSLALQGATPATGTGIAFPATQSASADANTLDDYEEGSFTPVLNRDSSSPTVTYVVQTGKYTKVGNMVTVTIALQTSAVSAAGSGNTTITGLPFANGSTTYTGQGSIGYNSAAVNTLSASWISSTSVYFRSGTQSAGNDGGGWTVGYLNMSITYLA